LKRAGREYKEAYDDFTNSDDTKNIEGMNEIATQIKILKLGIAVNVQIDNFRETENMKVFPFSISILSKFLTGVLIPFVFFIVQESIGNFLP
jgi:hypothetical protein